MNRNLGMTWYTRFAVIKNIDTWYTQVPQGRGFLLFGLVYTTAAITTYHL